MSKISIQTIENAVYKLCFEANTCLNDSVYSKIVEASKVASSQETKNLLFAILENAKIAYEKEMPLCQDTGQVIVFLEIGQDIQIKGGYIETAINKAVENCYKENYFRKSVVKNAISNRENTKTNTPVIIHTKIIEGDKLNIKVLIKGAGSENKSKLEMMLPTAEENEIISTIGDLILSAGENACPPMFIGIGVGLTADGAMLLSKQALISDNFSNKEIEFAKKIKEYVNSKAPKKYKNCFVLDIKLLTGQTHIACMPIGITINCHSNRFSSCTIEKNKVTYRHKIPDFLCQNIENTKKKEIYTTDIKKIKALKENENILLTGEIYVARDMAHKKLVELINSKNALPFDMKNKIIFYAGPCPAKPNETTGSIGPTTASRMDKYAEVLYKNGLIATIGKGSRSNKIKEIIKETNSKYFTIQGGIAALLAKKIQQSEIIAFDDLGAEALYKIYVEKFPIKVELA
ncbi:fumarate hydratase [bacterium]|nr:fumarate hydratase [bacterium]